MALKVLIIHDELNYCCGISSHLYHLLKELTCQNNISITLMISGGNAIERFFFPTTGIIINKNVSWNYRTPAKFLKAVIQTAHLVRAGGFRIVHAQNFYAANIASFARLLTGFHTIQSHHNHFNSQGKLRLARADYHVAVSPYIKDHLIECHNCGNDNTFFIPYGADIQFEETRLNPPPFRVLAASRLIKEKGLDTYIKAVSMLPDKIRTNTIFMIAGSGKEETALKKLNEELNTRIIFLGEVPKLSDLLLTTHIFVMPSQWDCEGYPMTLVEAALTGNVVISSRYKGYYSFCPSESDKLTFDSPADLADSLYRVLCGYHYWQEAAYRFRSSAGKDFSAPLMADSYLKLYLKAGEELP